MNHVHNTNKIIPKQRPRYALWTTHLDVYDPQDESTDCIGGVIGRLGEAMFPQTILFCSYILGDVKNELQSELGREPERKPEPEPNTEEIGKFEPGQEPIRETKPKPQPQPQRENQRKPEPDQKPDTKYVVSDPEIHPGWPKVIQSGPHWPRWAQIVADMYNENGDYFIKNNEGGEFFVENNDSGDFFVDFASIQMAQMKLGGPNWLPQIGWPKLDGPDWLAHIGWPKPVGPNEVCY